MQIAERHLQLDSEGRGPMLCASNVSPGVSAAARPGPHFENHSASGRRSVLTPVTVAERHRMPQPF